MMSKPTLGTFAVMYRGMTVYFSPSAQGGAHSVNDDGRERCFNEEEWATLKFFADRIAIASVALGEQIKRGHMGQRPLPFSTQKASGGDK